VNASVENKEMEVGSIEEFIFEHYYGYTKIDEQLSQEYRVNHTRWQVNHVQEYSINCNFRAMYGNSFSILSNHKPHSVILAEGSPITVDWKRISF
jgi:hypothetical protein